MPGVDRRFWVCLLLPIWQCCLLEHSSAEESAPRDVRSGRSTGETLELMEKLSNGVTFPVNLSTEVFGNFTGGTSRAAVHESLLIAGMEVDFEKAVGLPGLSFAVSGLYAEGTSLTNKAVHDFNTLSNIDSYDSLRLYELWMQEKFWDGKFSLRFGQMLADAEFFVSDYGALFINSSFGALPLVSQNLVPPIFPVAAPGLRLLVAPDEFFYAEAAAFSGNVGDAGTNNKHGTLFSVREDDGVLLFFEVGYRLNPPLPGVSAEVRPAPLSGTYKLGGFYDTGRFEDGGGRLKRGNGGFYLVVEQELWHPRGKGGRTLALFGRVGIAPDDRNLVPLYFDTGFSFQGILPDRADDTLGLAFSYTQLSSKLAAGGGDEKVLELTYRFALGDHIFLQPDVQFIFQSGATEPTATAVVAGLRLNLSY